MSPQTAHTFLGLPTLVTWYHLEATLGITTMQIDRVSEQVITLALLLEKLFPGTAGEIWLSDELKITLQQKADDIKNPDSLIENTRLLINDLQDDQRQQYLNEILHSILYQLDPRNMSAPYREFSRNTFGYEIERVTEEEIGLLENKIHELEEKLHQTRQQVYAKNKVTNEDLVSTLAHHIQTITNQLPSYLFNFPDEGISIKTTSGKPWSAFNTHTKPFTSLLLLNTDVGLSYLDLRRLACHETCAGHHTELSNKDQMLTELWRGEHGIVITFSPQTFISEAIAESMFDLLGILDERDDEMMMGWYYDRLIFALQNKATFLFFDDNLSRQEIDRQFQSYAISDQTRNNVLNFSCDPLFGRYAPVYYSSYLFLKELYQKAGNKVRFIKTLFSQPCTPLLLAQEIAQT